MLLALLKLPINHYLKSVTLPELPANATPEQKRAHFDKILAHFVLWLEGEEAERWAKENLT